MSKTFIHEGECLEFANTSAAIASGRLVKLGTRVGVAETDIAATTGAGTVCLCGVHEVSKLSTDVVAVYDELFLDNTNHRLTLSAAGNTFAGIAVLASGNGATTVRCLFQPGAVSSANAGQRLMALTTYATGAWAAAGGYTDAMLIAGDRLVAHDQSAPFQISYTVVTPGSPAIVGYTPADNDTLMVFR